MCLLLSIHLFLQIMHPHHLIPARVDDFNSNTRMFPRRKRQRFCAAEHLKTLCVNYTLEVASDFVPRVFVGKEGLRDTEGPTVIIRINKPRCHLVQHLCVDRNAVSGAGADYMHIPVWEYRGFSLVQRCLRVGCSFVLMCRVGNL